VSDTRTADRVLTGDVEPASAAIEKPKRAGLGRPWEPGQSGNPGGRPKGERALLQRMYGQDGQRVYARLEALRNDPTTPKRLKAQIDFFVIERMFGRAPQLVGVDTGPSLLSLLAEVYAGPTGGKS
jgi:hypothetical protein